MRVSEVVFLGTVIISCGPQMARPAGDTIVRVQGEDTIYAGPVDTSDAMTLDAMQRTSEAAAAVDTIIVRPDSLVLRVGQRVFLDDVIEVVALDEQGRPVDAFAPMIGVADRSVAEYGAEGLVARGVGRSRLSLSAFSIDPTARIRAGPAYVLIIVVP